jgi:hypothetical protein
MGSPEPGADAFDHRKKGRTNMSTIYRCFAAIYGSRKIPRYVVQCRAIVTRMEAIAQLQSPLLAQALDDIDALDEAEQATHKGSPAETADRNAKLLVVRCDMLQLKAIVQGAADADFANAAVLIESSGMSVVKRVVRTKPQLAAKYGKVPQVVVLCAKAFKGQGSYQWQMSLDGTTWLDLPGTVKATTSVGGLTPATVCYFRFRSLTGAGLSDWSMEASIIVH